MKDFARISLLALAAASAPLAAQDAPGDFRLPTKPTPTPSDIQGPVDPDAPIATRPRDTSPTPTPRPAPAPAPTPAPRPTIATTPRAVPPPANSSLPPRFTPPAAPTPQESAAVVRGETDFPGSPSAAAPPPAAAPTLAGPAMPSSPAVAAPSAAPDTDSTPGWLLPLIGLMVAAAALAAWLLARRRRARPVPTIARPPVAAPPPPAPAPEPAASAPAAHDPAVPLVLEARALRLSRSMVYATLSYELQATNRTGRPLANVRLGADLVTAHARIPTDQQLADPLIPLAPVRTLERLEPGESTVIAGELRLAVGDIRPIPHGQAVVYVPLLRLRAEADGLAPVARTFIVGMRPAAAGQRLQPFRLDEMPQTYSAVGQQALD